MSPFGQAPAGDADVGWVLNELTSYVRSHAMFKRAAANSDDIDGFIAWVRAVRAQRELSSAPTSGQLDRSMGTTRIGPVTVLVGDVGEFGPIADDGGLFAGAGGVDLRPEPAGSVDRGVERPPAADERGPLQGEQADEHMDVARDERAVDETAPVEDDVAGVDLASAADDLEMPEQSFQSVDDRLDLASGLGKVWVGVSHQDSSGSASASVAQQLGLLAATGYLLAEQADASQWPGRCVVCAHERGRLVVLKSPKKFRKHRKAEHAWLHAHLVRSGLVPA